MATRASMTDLVARLRVLVGDPADGATFLDEDLLGFLDERHTDVVEAQLRTRPSFSGSLNVYSELFAPRRWWEDSVVLHNAQGTILTPDAADLIGGRWTFTAGATIPVYITGTFYDMYGAAQAALEMWAASVAREFDFTTDQQTFDRTGKREGLLAVAREYARKAIQPGRRPAWRSLDW